MSGQRGIALPMALIALSVLVALMVTLSLLASTEPVIAGNQEMSARARAAAEAGLERALWALSHPSATEGIADPMPSSPAPAPYDGVTSSFRAITTVNSATQAGFVVRIASAASGKANERDVTSVGYVPDAVSPRATKRLVTTAVKLKRLDPPCLLCLGGETPAGTTSALQVDGGATVNGSNTSGSSPATYCSGQTPTSAILTTGVLTSSGSPNVIAPAGGTAMTQNAPAAGFEPFTLSDSDMALLKTIARANGTYYQGAQIFTTPPPNGLVFIDTPSGHPLGTASPASDLFAVEVRGDWLTGWRGWFIVAGSLQIGGRIDMTGLIYAQNDLDYHAQSPSAIRGAIIATNRIDAGSSQVHSDDDAGGGWLTYDCPAVRNGGGVLPENWFLKPGSYKEVAEQ
jgi:hypothetical protein